MLAKESRRVARLAKYPRGPGVFVYNGKAKDSVSTPTPKRTGRKEPVFDNEGLPVTDPHGRPVYRPAGKVVFDMQGRPILGGKPIVKHVLLDVFVVGGVPFKKGEPTEVENDELALKLRCMSQFFDELEAIAIEEEGDESESCVSGEPQGSAAGVVKRKRGRPPKVRTEDTASPPAQGQAISTSPEA